MHKQSSFKYSALVLLSSLATSTFAATPYSIEARGDGMGGVGVVSASYLTAPFYNPALTAIYRRNDDAGIILPSIGGTYDDQDKMLDSIDRLSDLLDSSDNVTQAQIDAIDSELSLIDDSEFNGELGGAFAVAVPNPYLSMNIFGKAYSETYVTADVGDCSTPSNENDCTLQRARNTTVDSVSVAVAEIGVAMARYSTVFGQHMSFGISPKLQRVYTYVYQATPENFDLKDIRKNSGVENMLNLDAGALWFYGPYRFGVTASNLVPHDIETKSITSSDGSPLQYSYKMRPLYAIGGGIVADFFTLSVDYDLNELGRYDAFDDNVQMLRVGAEIDLLRQLQLRVGYKKNVAYSGREPTYTAGVGLSPLGLFELDVAASYTNEDSMGAYVNFLASY
ncbi:MAG: conjugal transfer protein TraF [Vibrio sp.]